jgi:hypothetical protein
MSLGLRAFEFVRTFFENARQSARMHPHDYGSIETGRNNASARY